MILVQTPLPRLMPPGPAHPRSSKSHIVSLHPLLSFLVVTTPFQIHEWNNDAGKGRSGEHKLEKMLHISLAVKKQRERRFLEGTVGAREAEMFLFVCYFSFFS